MVEKKQEIWIALLAITVLAFIFFPGHQDNSGSSYQNNSRSFSGITGNITKVETDKSDTPRVIDYAKINNSINETGWNKYKTIMSCLGDSGKLSVDNIDKQYLSGLEGQEHANFDKRTSTMLYLLLFNHSLKVRLISGHETEQKAMCNDEDNSNRFVSAHYSGQAIDIFAADGVDFSWRNSSDKNLRELAKNKISQLLTEILYIGAITDAYGNKKYRPTQLIIEVQQDVWPHSSESDNVYGNGSPGSGAHLIESGSRMGFSYHNNFVGRIHIGY